MYKNQATLALTTATLCAEFSDYSWMGACETDTVEKYHESIELYSIVAKRRCFWRKETDQPYFEASNKFGMRSNWQKQTQLRKRWRLDNTA